MLWSENFDDHSKSQQKIQIEKEKEMKELKQKIKAINVRKKKSTLLIKETKVFLQHLHLHNTKNQKALDWQVFHTLDDVVAIHINISMQLPAPTLKC
jgi:flagellar motility protein MotE (MotC chaperone)